MNDFRQTGAFDVTRALIVQGFGGEVVPAELGRDVDGFRAYAFSLFAKPQDHKSIELQIDYICALDICAALIAQIMESHERVGQLDALQARIDQHRNAERDFRAKHTRLGERIEEGNTE